MTSKQPAISLFKRQNDVLVFNILQQTDADWIVLNDVVLEKDGIYHLSGNEYVILHSRYGIVILDILPTLSTADEARDILLEKIKHEAPGYCLPIQICAVEHKNIETLSKHLNDLTQQVEPKLVANDREWIESVRKSLRGAFLGPPAATEHAHLPADANFAETRKLKPYKSIASAVTVGAASVLMLLLTAQYFLGQSALDDTLKIALPPASPEIMPTPYSASKPVFGPVAVDQVARPDTDATPRVAAPVNVPSVPLPVSVLPPPAPISPPSPAAPKLEEAYPAVGQGHNDQGRMPRYSAATLNPAPRPNAARCQAIVLRAQLGALQTSDLQFLRRGC